jgi:hypothetical protein
MVTKRTPLHRSPRRAITPSAVSIFARMRTLEFMCTCTPNRECGACKEWWLLQSELCDELGTKPWQWPCVESGEACVHPPDTAAAEWHPHARELYRLLSELCA